MKKTGLAYSNIAFIKYWGKVSQALRLPLNGSISMNLSNLETKTTVEFSHLYKKHDITIDGEKKENEVERVIAHLDRIRLLAKSPPFAKVVSKNNFPSSSGLSSSASGFAALTLAAATALRLNLSEKELSIQARLGSGSACRSIPGGFVEWLNGDKSEKSYAYSIFPASYWQIVDIVAIVSNLKKSVPTSLSQIYALKSPFMQKRLALINEKINRIKNAIKNKNFPEFGELVEAECLELHSVIMTQTPSFIYFLPKTLSLLHQVRNWRSRGLMVYFTVNTGHDVHLICQRKDQDKVQKAVSLLPFVKKTIVNYPAGPAHLSVDHLF